MLLDGIYFLSPGITESLVWKQERGLMLYYTASGMLLDGELDFDIKDGERVHIQRESQRM